MSEETGTSGQTLEEAGTPEQGAETISMQDVTTLVSKEVQKALDIQKKKHEKELKTQKSLSGLDEEARAKLETEQKISALEEELAKHRLTSTKSEIGKVLSKRGLSTELVDYVVFTDDVDECIEKIDTLEKIFKNMVKEEVNKKLKSTTPKNATNSTETILTKDTFKNLSLAEQNKIFVENKELYLELTR